MFLLSVFVLAQFLLSREISGKDEVLTRLNSQINELTQLLALEQSNTQDAEDAARQSPGLAGAGRSRERTPAAAAARPGRRRRRRRPSERIGTLSGELDSERQLSQRALSQVELLNQQIAALRKQIGALEEALDVSEIARPRIQHQDRRSRPAPERRAGAARAGAQPLPFRFLRPAARDPRRPREHPHRRRPLRLPVGSAVSGRAPRRSTTPARSR